MTYQPKSEEQLAKEGLYPDGEYDFEVIETFDNPSKKKADGSGGNPMFTLKLRVIAADGSSFYVTDYIALSSNFGERKLRHAASACGLLDIYTSGKLIAENFKDRAGRVTIKTQDGTADYPLPKNVVKDYVKNEDGAVANPKAATPVAPLDDQIPF